MCPYICIISLFSFLSRLEPNAEAAVFLQGCLSRLHENTFYYLTPMLSVAICLGTLQLILITLSFYMCRAISKALK